MKGPSIIDRDIGFKKFQAEMSKAKGSYVTVGVHEKDNETYENGQTVSQVAYFNEFGTRNVPERSFLRSTIDKDKEEIRAKQETLFNKVMTFKTSVLDALNMLGFDIMRRMQNTIRAYAWLYPDKSNAPSTMAHKRGNKPLIDSGKLLRSINFEAKVSKW